MFGKRGSQHPINENMQELLDENSDMYIYSSEYRYEKTAEFAWLTRNVYQYGFVLSYSAGYSAITGFGFEPWHWRYVGVDVATDMHDKRFATYQEYWAT